MTRDRAFTSIETPRLRLRRFRDDDADALLAYRSDPEVARFQSWRDPTADRIRAFLAELRASDPGVPGDPFQFAVATRDDDVLVGDCMLAIDAADPPAAEIGYTVAPARQGGGIATEAVGALVDYAFERLGVAVVRAVTDTRNAASIAVVERLGMTLVGTVQTTFKGEPCDEHTFELRREAWEARRAPRS